MDYFQLFKQLPTKEPRAGLKMVIFSQIQRKQVRLVRQKLVWHTLLLVGCIVALIPGWRYFITDFSQSGMQQYLSLLFSDASLVLRYWQDFILSLAESLPIISGVVILAIIFILLDSLKRIAGEIKLASWHFNHNY
jgi:hypothetical protein